MDIPVEIQTFLDITGDMYVDHVIECDTCNTPDKCEDGTIYVETLRNIRKYYPKAAIPTF